MCIAQDLPYGTMGDDEMRNLNIGCLQDDGVIFLWVTGERDHYAPHIIHTSLKPVGSPGSWPR